jgi:large subunit ribosomal protein L17
MAILREIVISLIVHGRIETTLARAKAAQRVIERIITRARRERTASGRPVHPVHARRMARRFLQDETVVKELFDSIVPRYLDRPGGYTRVLKGRIRRGDGAQMAILEFV